MTTFPDRLYHMGGAPVTSGGIPLTYGDTYFVDYDNGADRTNRGKKIDSAFKTVSYANDALTTNNHDLVLLSAVSEHATTAKLTVAKNRTHWIGLEGGGRYFGQRSRIGLGATTTITSTMRTTGVGNVFRNIKFSNQSNTGSASYVVEDGGEYSFFENCEFYKSDDMDQTSAAELLANGDSSFYRACTFGSLATATSGAINRPCVMFDRELIAGKVARDNMFEDCLFWRNAGNSGNIFIEVTAGNDVERMILFRHCTFIANILGQTMTNVIESAATNAHVMFIDCNAVNCGSWATSATNAGVYVEQKLASTTDNEYGLMIQAT